MAMETKVKEEVAQMQSFLEIECSDDPVELKERISTICVYHARLSYLYVEAKKVLRRAKAMQISETVIKIAKEHCLSASVQKVMIESICEDEQYDVDMYERLQASCKHALDGARSVLSHVKEEMSVQGYYGNK